MYKFLPYMTNDYSTGLYCEGVNDIYHSAGGALSEAYEKFVLPLNIKELLSKTDKLKVLDVCYGVGYNTKALLNEILKTDLSDKEINIDCVDNDKILIELSPFIKFKINFWDRLFHKKLLRKNAESYSEAKKILDSPKGVIKNFKIDNYVIQILLKNLMDEYGDEFLSSETKKIISDHDNFPFFNKRASKIYQKLGKIGVYLHLNKNNSTFVHNIYYENISKRFIYKYNKRHFNNIRLKFYPFDIREYLKQITNLKYDVVMLDGFTPSKCPCIWSVDFFNKLYSLMNDNSVLVTYNTSAPVRNAMRLAGFCIGNTLDDKNNIIGTTATKSFIKHSLSEKNLGLLNTKAGIPYRDENLSLDNDTILVNRDIEIKSSDLISSSQYLKQWEKQYEK